MKSFCKILSMIQFFLVIFCQSCSTLPSLENRTVTMAMLDTDATRLGKAIAPMVQEHPGKSGIHALAEARQAFAARMLLAHWAERSIDVQYYIWHNDITGTKLFESLRAAADRGVRVRILLDDINTSGLDGLIAVLDSHPKIEVRLFNPFVIRRPRFWSLMTDFSRLNRRMHNKSFTVDNQATIIGGRNIGDEYFGAGESAFFADLDVLAIGPVVKDVSKSFDNYWISASAYPADLLLPPVEPDTAKEVKDAIAATELSPEAVEYAQDVYNSALNRDLQEQKVSFEWAKTRVISDDPAKGLGAAPPEVLVGKRLRGILGGDQMKHVNLVSPYFVPTNDGVEFFSSLAANGAKIKILTNSIEASDVSAVHAGYSKSRKKLLEAGISLYEFRRLADGKEKSRLGLFKSSNTSLHAKTFSVDSERVFIGSFNLDQRSAKLNTEMGVIIDSPVLAMQMDEAFMKTIPAFSYEVQLTPDGELFWLEHKEGKIVRYDTEPGTSFWSRMWIGFLSILPIDWML